MSTPAKLAHCQRYCSNSSAGCRFSQVGSGLPGAQLTTSRICVPMPLPTGSENRLKASVQNAI